MIRKVLCAERVIQIIDIQSKKYLVLEQTVSIQADGAVDTGALINSSRTKLKAHHLSTIGPPIIWEKIDFDGKKVTLGRKIILQCLGDATKIPTGFERGEKLKIGPCIYARFVGKEEDLIFASHKACVYAYENEIQLKKESYTVYVEKNNDVAMIDIFMPYDDYL
ncbi:MAG: hypothetical protein FWC29_04540 [Methanomassiliicoccaceae archaeon]|nr:hypothetical protein [Methanomassiliicoccaceae archaeon]